MCFSEFLVVVWLRRGRGGGAAGGGDGQQTVGCCTRSCYFCPPAATVRLPRHVAGSASAFNAASRPQPMKARRAGFVFFFTNGSAERLGAAFLRTNGSRGKKKKKKGGFAPPLPAPMRPGRVREA